MQIHSYGFHRSYSLGALRCGVVRDCPRAEDTGAIGGESADPVPRYGRRRDPDCASGTVPGGNANSEWHQTISSSNGRADNARGGARLDHGSRRGKRIHSPAGTGGRAEQLTPEFRAFVRKERRGRCAPRQLLCVQTQLRTADRPYRGDGGTDEGCVAVDKSHYG